MSRPVASTPSARKRCWACCATSAASARWRCCSPHTTRRWPRSPIRSMNCATVVWARTRSITVRRRWISRRACDVPGMSLSGIRYIFEARLQARAVLVQEGFAILGIAVGVALLFASQVSGTSLARSVTQLNQQLVGTAQLQLDARGPEGFDERVLREVRQIPGVQAALPILDRQVNVIGALGERSVDLIGVDPHSVFASGPLLRRFSARQIANLHAI